MHETTLPSHVTKLQTSIRRNFRELQVELEKVQRKEVAGLAVIIAQASVTRDAGFHFDGGSSSSTHTIVYYEAPDPEFPRFSVGAMGLLLRVAGGLGLPGGEVCRPTGVLETVFRAVHRAAGDPDDPPSQAA